MGFRQFITNRLYRRQCAESLQRYLDVTPPLNPSPRYIAKLVKQLLHPVKSRYARKELSMIGPPIAPALLSATKDKRYLNVSSEGFDGYDSPFEMLLELLSPLDPLHAVEFAKPMLASASSDARRQAIRCIAGTGLTDVIPLVESAFSDPDEYVRSAAASGVESAGSGSRATDGFRHQAYALVLHQLSCEKPSNAEIFVRALIACERGRAEIDLQHFVSISNPLAATVLGVCNDFGVVLSEPALRTIYERALQQYERTPEYPYGRIIGESLKALCLSVGEETKPILIAACDSNIASVRTAALECLMKLAGADDPVRFVLERLQAAGYANLTEPQRIIFCAHLFDMEVKNGGITQFFGNSGEYTADVLEALRRLGDPTSLTALETAVKCIGPLSFEQDQGIRLSAFERRFDELLKVFRPLESAFYENGEALPQCMYRFVIEHKEHFRRADQSPL